MARGVKTNEEDVQRVLASYAVTNSFNATAKETGVSNKTCKSIVESHPEEFAKVSQEKKKQFAEQATEIIDKALVLLNRRITTALANQDELEDLIDLVMEDNDKDIDDKSKMTRKEKLDIAKKLSRLELNGLSEITTAVGTLYDKRSLSKGDSTENNKFEVEVKVIK